MTKTRIALVGLGRMGRNHLRVLREMKDVELVAIVEPQSTASDAGGTPIVKTVAELAKRDFEAVVVATPTASHHEVVTELVAMKKHVLVEKPIASTFVQARELIELAQKAGVKLAVGHVERFNPAVRKLREIITEGWLGTPIHFAFTRVGGYPETVLSGNNVLLDLAVHDIDVLRSLVGPLKLENSMCHATWREGVFDTAEIILSAGSGASASVHVNWITPTKIRSIRVTGTRGVCFVDYILQTCELLGGSLLRAKEPSISSYDAIQELYRATDRIQFGVQKVEPLRAQAEQFLRFLANDEIGELCHGRDALAAVILAERAIQAERGRVKRAPVPATETLAALDDEWI